MAHEGEPALAQLFSTSRDVVEHTVKQLGPGDAQRVAGTSHLWRAAAHTALSAQGLPLHVTKLVATPSHNDPMDVCAMPGGDGCLVSGWCGLYVVSADGAVVAAPLEWSSAPTETNGPNPADPGGSQAARAARHAAGSADIFAAYPIPYTKASSAARTPVMAAAVAADGAIFTVSEPRAMSTGGPPECHRLEKFVGGELVAFVDFTSPQELHVGPLAQFDASQLASQWSQLAAAGGVAPPPGHDTPTPLWPGEGMIGQNLALTSQIVFVADTRNSRIAAFSASTLEPKFTFGYEGLSPRGVEKDAQGGGSFFGAYTVSMDLSLKEHAPGALKSPRGMAVMGDELAVVDTKNERLQVYGTDGVHARSIEPHFFRGSSIEDVAAGHGHLYCTQSRHAPSHGCMPLTRTIVVLVLTPAGQLLQRVRLPGGVCPGPCVCVSGAAVWVGRRKSGFASAQINLLTLRDAALSPSAAVDAGAARAAAVAAFEAHAAEVQRQEEQAQIDAVQRMRLGAQQ